MIHVRASSAPSLEELRDEVPVRERPVPSVEDVLHDVRPIVPNVEVHETPVVQVDLTILHPDTVPVTPETRTVAHATKVHQTCGCVQLIQLREQIGKHEPKCVSIRVCMF